MVTLPLTLWFLRRSNWKSLLDGFWKYIYVKGFKLDFPAMFDTGGYLPNFTYGLLKRARCKWGSFQRLPLYPSTATKISTLWWFNIAIENGPVESSLIYPLIAWWIFPSLFANVYQRLSDSWKSSPGVGNCPILGILDITKNSSHYRPYTIHGWVMFNGDI